MLCIQIQVGSHVSLNVEEDEEELVFMPHFLPPYGSLKEAYYHLPLLSPLVGLREL